MKDLGFLPGVLGWAGTNLLRLTSSPKTLVSDQPTTPGKNPKAFTQHVNSGEKLQSQVQIFGNNTEESKLLRACLTVHFLI
jgi:hypothetical protein